MRFFLAKFPAACLAAYLLATGTAVAAEQAFPAKRITMIVPFSAGSATDLMARVVAQGVSEQTGQAVVVDNRAGASGMIGASAVSRAEADGYTLLVTTNTTQAGNQYLFKNMSYDPDKDFAPITLLGRGEQVMVVSPSSKAKTVAEFIDMARQSPGKYTFGAGTVNPRIAAEMLQQMTGTKLLYVPYKGNPEVVADLIGGRIDMAIIDSPTVYSHIKSGSLRALGTTGATRFPLLPEVPTIAESGLPGYEIGYWFAAYAPAGTPPAVVARLNELLVKATQGATAQRFYQSTSIRALTTSPAELGVYQANESKKWGEVIRKAGITPE